jgi:hypothetical protein
MTGIPTTCLSSLEGNLGIFPLGGANVMNLSCNFPPELYFCPSSFYLVAVFSSASILVLLVYFLMTLIPLFCDSYGLFLTRHDSDMTLIPSV